MLAYGISPSPADAAGATALSSRLAGRAGTARITASASMYSGAGAGPIVSRQPFPWVRPSSRAIAPVRTVAPDAFATASGSSPSPFTSVPKTARGGPGTPAGSNDPAAAASEARLPAAPGSPGNAAPKDSPAARPASTPPSSGSTSRSPPSAPSRAPTYAPTDTSP